MLSIRSIAFLLLLLTRHVFSAALELKPRHIEGIEGELRQGRFEVYENRKAKSGRRIALNILVLPAVAAHKDPDPLFILAGGPGQAATENARFNGRVFAQFVALATSSWSINAGPVAPMGWSVTYMDRAFRRICAT